MVEATSPSSLGKRHETRGSGNRITNSSAQVGLLGFAAASAIGFAAAIVAAPYARPHLTMAGAIVAGVTVAIAIPVSRWPRLAPLVVVTLLYYAALTLLVLGAGGQSEGLLALAAIPLVASALYGRPSLTITALVAATATLGSDGLINRLSVADYAQLLVVWPIAGVGIAYATYQLRSRLEQTVNERSETIQHDAVLALIADEMYATLDKDEVLRLGVQSAARLTDLAGQAQSKAGFFLVDGDRATLVAFYDPDLGGAALSDKRIGDLSVSLLSTVHLHQAAASHEDRLFILDHNSYAPPEIAAMLAELDVETAIVQLVRVGDDASGLLAVFKSDASAPGYSHAQGEWLRALTPLFELALSRALVFEAAATIDELTGIANRREFDRRLASTPRRAEYSLLAIDIDKLKVMNDTYGHKAGDELLQAVAGALRRSVRRGDVAARVGGDEFSVLLSDADPGHAEAVADRILAELAKSSVRDQLPSVSIGIAGFDSGEDAAARIAAADRALYEAKAAGGNRAAHAAGTNIPTQICAPVALPGVVGDV
ncbi:MAG: GGDEF domain-containing protein [Candidatus Dormiibacterota bacterium]